MTSSPSYRSTSLKGLNRKICSLQHNWPNSVTKARSATKCIGRGYAVDHVRVSRFYLQTGPSHHCSYLVTWMVMLKCLMCVCVPPAWTERYTIDISLIGTQAQLLKCPGKLSKADRCSNCSPGHVIVVPTCACGYRIVAGVLESSYARDSYLGCHITDWLSILVWIRDNCPTPCQFPRAVSRLQAAIKYTCAVYIYMT